MRISRLSDSKEKIFHRFGGQERERERGRREGGREIDRRRDRVGKGRRVEGRRGRRRIGRWFFVVVVFAITIIHNCGSCLRWTSHLLVVSPAVLPLIPFPSSLPPLVYPYTTSSITTTLHFLLSNSYCSSLFSFQFPHNPLPYLFLLIVSILFPSCRSLLLPCNTSTQPVCCGLVNVIHFFPQFLHDASVSRYLAFWIPRSLCGTNEGRSLPMNKCIIVIGFPIITHGALAMILLTLQLLST